LSGYFLQADFLHMALFAGSLGTYCFNLIEIHTVTCTLFVDELEFVFTAITEMFLRVLVYCSEIQLFLLLVDV